MTKQLQNRMESLKQLAEKTQKKKNKKKQKSRFRDELAGLSLTEAMGGLDFASAAKTDTSFYDFDCALAARKDFSASDDSDYEYTIQTDDGIGL